MSLTLELFPVLSEELIVKSGYISTNYEFKYLAGEIQHSLEAKPFDASKNSSDILLISDERCEWTPDTHNLVIKRTYTINNPFFLFGENGVACEDAELGLALAWTSKSSNLRGVKEIGSFRCRSEKVVLDLNLEFSPGQFRGIVQLHTVLFLKNPGVSLDHEKHLANTAGVLLGTFDQFTIILDGNGSMFPIVEVFEPSQPLWWVRCDWTDPLIDRFDEDIQICLNGCHPNYKLLKTESGLKGSPLLIEIIASALQIIVEKLKESEYWEDIISGRNYEQGSIAEAANYFITNFQWDTHSSERLALTIRKDLESRI